jgi:uncharacterized membrane protein
MGIAVSYAAYLAISIGLTVIVASALSRSGRVYLAGVFGGDEAMATAVNRMVVLGFCLLSLGYAALTMRASADVHGAGAALGALSVKVGEELLVLGALHLVSMMIFARLRRRQTAARPGGPGTGGRAGTTLTPGPGGLALGSPGTASPAPGPAGGATWPAAATAAEVLH